MGVRNTLYELPWTKEQLWQGCLLASIAHAIMVAHYPDLAHEHSWDGINYNVQNSSGARGTVTFHSRYCLAAFRDDHSERMSIQDKVQAAYGYFANAPKEIKDLAETETLLYLLEYADGKTFPSITAAFWETTHTLFSVDTFADMITHGGFLLEKQAMASKAAIKAWAVDYQMSAQQCELLATIYTRKAFQPTGIFLLSKSEIALIGTDNPVGMEESKTSFREIGIQWEA